ncbi:hypothetical protein [Paratractidigestivibacter sp.]|uniref:hypothetical protein n=1 Tax=Paratractidigestivibacter sp. TaxID=2847316 RepID=UPI002AC8ADAC|nr:hypothetical protein [Paratractidigestivibacter sp.]
MATITRKPSVTITGLPTSLAKPLEAVKQSIEMITGARPGMSELKGLPDDAGLLTVIEKINEIIARINASGKDNV